MHDVGGASVPHMYMFPGDSFPEAHIVQPCSMPDLVNSLCRTPVDPRLH